MQTAFVLVSCDVGKSEQVKDQLKIIPEVNKAIPVYGIYDILVELEAEDNKILNEIIKSKLRNIPHLRSTITLSRME